MDFSFLNLVKSETRVCSPNWKKFQKVIKNWIKNQNLITNECGNLRSIVNKTDKLPKQYQNIKNKLAIWFVNGIDGAAENGW